LGAENGGDGGKEGVNAVVRLEVETVVEDGGFLRFQVPLGGGDEGALLSTTGRVPSVFDGVFGAVEGRKRWGVGVSVFCFEEPHPYSHRRHHIFLMI
jgi:hypothetical protein